MSKSTGRSTPSKARLKSRTLVTHQPSYLSVGAYRYEVRRQRNIRYEGNRVDGLYDADARVILLDADLPRDHWLEVLRHEYEHAWQYHAGFAHEAEARCRWAALVDETFSQQLAALGGIGFVENLSIVDHADEAPPDVAPLAKAEPTEDTTPLDRLAVTKRDWVGEFNFLRELLHAHRPPQHAVRFAFDECEAGPHESAAARSEEIARCVQRFYSDITQEEQREILNGWRPIGDRPTPANVDPLTGVVALRWSVLVSPKSHDGEFVVDEMTSPAKVQVFEGHTKAQVLRYLDAIRRHLDENWLKIIDAAPDRYTPGCSHLPY